MNRQDSQYTDTEEFLHALSHATGVVLGIIGLVWMLDISIESSDPWRVVASSVYGTSLISLFLSSTLYHGLHRSRRRHIFKLLDHCAIYLLIAGTYTPFLLVAIRSHLGWWLFGAIWSLALAGIATKLWLRHRYPRLGVVSYLIMGWIVMIAAPEVADAIGTKGMMWLIAGGIAYTVGTFFYMAKRLIYSHAVWHVFVLVGAACHFLAIVRYVLPVTEPASMMVY